MRNKRRMVGVGLEPCAVLPVFVPSLERFSVLLNPVSLGWGSTAGVVLTNAPRYVSGEPVEKVRGHPPSVLLL